MLPHLFERVVEFAQDVVLVEDLALVAMLVVVVDLLPHVGWKLVEGHVLLHLLVLEKTKEACVNKTRGSTTGAFVMSQRGTTLKSHQSLAWNRQSNETPVLARR